MTREHAKEILETVSDFFKQLSELPKYEEWANEVCDALDFAIADMGTLQNVKEK